MKVKLTWVDRNARIDGTYIYRSEQRFEIDDLPPLLATTGPGVLEYVDESLERNKVYFYRFATFRGDDIAFSEPVSILTLPHTGPGPQRLEAGDYDLGFFGEVSAIDFFTGQDLAGRIGLTEGLAENDAAGWFKVASKGKVLFIAKNTLRSGATWRAIYDAGCVYGTDDDGLYPIDPPRNQFTVVRRDGDAFSVRLLKGYGGDLHTAFGRAELPETADSEWDRIIYRMAMEMPVNQKGQNWRSYVRAEIQSRSSWCQEKNAASDHRLTRGGTAAGVAGLVTSSESVIDSTLPGWRPVLEYLPDL